MPVKPDIERMERDILEAVYELGGLENFHTAGSRALTEKYGSNSDVQRQLEIVSDYLVDKRFLFPLYRSDMVQAQGFTRGITPKGFRRLQELKHPFWTWFKANWFAVMVASITAGLALASVLVDIFKSASSAST